MKTSTQNRKWQVLAAIFCLSGTLVLAACGTQSDGDDTSPPPDYAQKLAGSPPQLAAIHEQANELLDGGLDAFNQRITDVKGFPAVVNVWASWCAPCVSELPVLEKVWAAKSAAKEPVVFIGIDFRESAERGRAMLQKAAVTYPRLSDESGVLILALQGKAPTVPTTLVLDHQGRIAARVSGAVQESILTGLIDDVVAES